jgi:hypothetical protein
MNSRQRLEEWQRKQKEKLADEVAAVKQLQEEKAA